MKNPPRIKEPKEKKFPFMKYSYSIKRKWLWTKISCFKYKQNKHIRKNLENAS